MKILYIILTCQKYAETRQRWQRDTWLKGCDYVYLDDDQGGGYKEAPLKYVRYLRSTTLEHDWYFFCDDDTFVFPNKVCPIFITNEPVFTGFKGGKFTIHNLSIAWCSGGAGILMNRALVEKMQLHLRHTEQPLVTHETDISLAIWAKMSCNATVVDNKRFSPFKPSETPMKDCVTYHYCEQHDFYTLKEKL